MNHLLQKKLPKVKDAGGGGGVVCFLIANLAFLVKRKLKSIQVYPFSTEP